MVVSRRGFRQAPTSDALFPGVVVGLEIHARLATRSQLFCPCPADGPEPPNTRICPVCFGLPGALPVPNREAVRLAARLALAVGARIERRSAWCRKAYFYPDLPKGYQITQHDEPLAHGGAIVIEDDAGEPLEVAIERIHVEEDAARSVHPRDPGSTDSLLDFNRAGVPLVEIVTLPCLRSAEQARRTVERLRTILLATGVSDARMERGSLRCDANVSVAGRPDRRVEIKNLNSLRALRRAVEHEAARLAAEGPSAGRARQTRGWDERAGRTFAMRGKEGPAEYRYFPEPDMPPLILDDELLRAAGEDLPEPPARRIARWQAERGVPVEAARLLAAHPDLAAYFEALVGAGAPAAAAARWLLNDGRRVAGPSGVPPVPAAAAARLVRRLAEASVPGPALRAAFEAAVRGEGRLDDLLDRLSPRTGDRGPEDLDRLCREVLEAHPAQARTFRAGRPGVLEFLVGQVMKRAGGRLDAVAVRRRLRELLGDLP